MGEDLHDLETGDSLPGESWTDCGDCDEDAVDVGSDIAGDAADTFGMGLASPRDWSARTITRPHGTAAPRARLLNSR